MRLLILIFLIAVASCSGVSDSVPPEQSIIGSWKLMRTEKKPLEVERVTESERMTGRFTFRPDNTFDGEVTYPKSPEINTKLSGTYAVEDGILTMFNQTNSSTTKSTLKFEKDFMIAKQLNPEGLIAYYKRIN